MRVPKMRDINIEQRVAVNDEEALVEAVERVSKRAGGAARRPVVHKLDADAVKASAVAKILDLVGGVVNEEEDIGDSAGTQRIDLMMQQRSTADVDERLGPASKAFAQPRSLPARQNDCLAHACSSAQRCRVRSNGLHPPSSC